ncbi:hypothetical protein [Streptomyces sp. NPDC055210]
MNDLAHQRRGEPLGNLFTVRAGGCKFREALVSLLYASEPVQINSATPSCDCLAHVYGNAADHPEREGRYPSDMTNAKWAAIRQLLPVLA